MGSLSIWWSPEDEWVYPHSVSVGESHVFVTATRLFDPGFDSFQRSYLYWLDKDTLAQADVRPLMFNPTDNDCPKPYFLFLGMWEAAPAGTPEASSCTTPLTALSSPQGSPERLHPDWFNHPRTIALFRFAAVLASEQPFVHVADLGDEMPVLMCRTATGLCGNWEVQLPVLRKPMIEILNPDLTPFDNLIPDFQAGEDSTPISGPLPRFTRRASTTWQI